MENNNNTVFTNSLNSMRVQNHTVALLSGSIFLKKADAENGDPIIRKTNNGHEYFVLRGTYNRKAAAYAYGEDNIGPADENGNVQLYINCALTEDAVQRMNSSRAAAGDNIQILGTAVPGKASEGRLPSLWLSTAQPVFIKERGANGTVKLDRNAVSLRCYSGNEEQIVSVIRGHLQKGYNDAPAVAYATSMSGTEYCRMTLAAELTQHEVAAAFAEEDGNGPATKHFIRGSAFGFTKDRIARANLVPGDTVTAMGATSIYNGGTKPSKQMTISRLVGYKKAEVASAPAEQTAAAAPAAPAKPAPAPAPAPVVSPLGDDFAADDGDDYDLPF